MKVSVVIFMGNRFNIEVQPTDTVLKVKEQIEKIQGAQIHPREQQLLIYRGKVLKDETTIKENKVSENTFLVVKLSKTLRYRERTFDVQNPCTKEFSSVDLKWVKVKGRLGIVDDVAVIPSYRVDDFVKGEGSSAGTKFCITARKTNAEDSSHKKKKRADATLQRTTYYCRYGPGRKPTEPSKKKCEGRPRTRRGCLSRFTATRRYACPFVAFIKYKERKHVDKSGCPCHKPRDDKAIGTRFMTRPSNHGGTDPPLTLGPSNHGGTEPKLTLGPSNHRGINLPPTWCVKKKRTKVIIQGKVSTA